MSMPQYLVVAVVSGEVSYKKGASDFGGEKASAAAAILLGKNKESSIAPFIFPVAFTRCREGFVRFALTQGYAMAIKPAYPRLINPQEVDIWLALDKNGEQEANNRIAQQGFSTSEFYRSVFPDPVLDCGIAIPDPVAEESFPEWFAQLEEKLLPWKEKIWNAFFASS